MKADGQPLDWPFDPLEALRRWPTDRQALLLHSGRFDPRWARWSMLASPTGVYRFGGDRAGGAEKPGGRPAGRSQWLGPSGSCPVDRFAHCPFADLRKLLDRTDGVWIGYLGYDLSRWTERRGRRSDGAVDDRHWPVIELGHCPGYLLYDTQLGRWSAHGTWSTLDGHGSGVVRPVLADEPVRGGVVTSSGWNSVLDRAGYEQRVEMVKRYVANGDVFQVNLAQRFTAGLSVPPGWGDTPVAVGRSLFGQLAAVSPAWYGAYLELAADARDPTAGRVGRGPVPGHRAVLSTSPELFLSVAGRNVLTRPIKGTRPASVHPNELRDSGKDVAELNMIVDLMRNDLGRVCDYGTVRVDQARVIESHPTVHHGVSTIRGRLHPTKDVVDLLRATLPAGSITGAPKVRAMQIIDELEPVCRGPYSGCVGFLSRDSACLSVAIRTMMSDQRRGRVDFSVGGGIVAESQPASEYQETLDKAAAMVSALGRRSVGHSTPAVFGPECSGSGQHPTPHLV